MAQMPWIQEIIGSTETNGILTEAFEEAAARDNTGVSPNFSEERQHRQVSGFCPSCISLLDCPLPTKGWRPIPPDQTYPEWAYEKCQNLKIAEQDRQYRQTVSARWSERNLTTYQVTDDNREAYDVCKAYAKKLSPATTRGLYIFGPVGVGKSHLGVGIIKTAFQKGLYGAVINVPSTLRKIRDSFKDHSVVVQDEVYAKKRFVVLLDDIGAENATPWAIETIYSIVDARYESNLPTIITSNCSPAELTKDIGARSTDRIREMCDIVEIRGLSWRGNKKLAEEAAL
jgi:DNA replication protein DnaC